MRRDRSSSLPAVRWAALLLLLSLPLPAASQDLGRQLEEVGKLIGDRDYVTALDDLRFIAQQIQELRLAEAAPLFPKAPPGWRAEKPLRTSRETDVMGKRLEVRRRYLPEDGGGKVEVTFDFFSPLIPSVSLSLNPVYLAADPQAEAVEYGGEQGRLTFNPDTGEGELALILDNRILITIVGRAIPSRSTLRDFAAGLDYQFLGMFAPP